MGLTSAKVIHCPACFRKLCKIRDLNGEPIVEVKHKGLTVMSRVMAIVCISCKVPYTVNGPESSINRIAG